MKTQLPFLSEYDFTNGILEISQSRKSQAPIRLTRGAADNMTQRGKVLICSIPSKGGTKADYLSFVLRNMGFNPVVTDSIQTASSEIAKNCFDFFIADTGSLNEGIRSPIATIDEIASQTNDALNKVYLITFGPSWPREVGQVGFKVLRFVAHWGPISSTPHLIDCISQDIIDTQRQKFTHELLQKQKHLLSHNRDGSRSRKDGIEL